MKEELIEIQDVYDKEGYWIKSSVDSVPVFIPKFDHPIVQFFITPDTEWVMQKKFMTKREYEEIFKHPLKEL